MTKRPKPLSYEGLSDRALADVFGIARKAAKAEQTRQAALTAELVKRGKAQYHGATYTVVKVVGASKRFDGKAVIAEMGQPWYDARQVPITVTSWAVSLTDAVEAALDAIGAPADDAAAAPRRGRRKRASTTV